MYFRILVLIVSLAKMQVSCKTSAREKEAEYFTNTWSVLILGGVDKAKEVAKRLGLEFVQGVSPSQYFMSMCFVQLNIPLLCFSDFRRTCRYLSTARS